MLFFRFFIVLSICFFTGSNALSKSHAEVEDNPAKEKEGAIKPAIDNSCESVWKPIGYEVAPFPDTNVQYLSYQFRVPAGKKLALRIEGDFPIARYMSYHAYDQVTEQSHSSLLDSDIKAANGSINPYKPGEDRYAKNRSYGIWVTCEGEPNISNEPELKVPCSNESDRLVDIWYRVYVNEGKLISPTVKAYDPHTLKPTACPPLQPKEFSIATTVGVGGVRAADEYLRGRVPLPLKSGNVSMYWPNSDSLGANDHNIYLSTRLDGKALSKGFAGRAEKVKLKRLGVINDIGDVTVLKFKVPKFPNTAKGLTSFSGKEEVRYWSLCVSGEQTDTSNCLLDADVKTVKDEKGEEYAIVVIGPDDAKFKAEVEKRGMNYLNHSKHRSPILFYRQLLARPDFAGRTDRVKRITVADATKPESELTPFLGETKIGEYAPKGKQCWKSESFFKDFCGFSEIKALLK